MLFLLPFFLAALAIGVGGSAIPSNTNITSLATPNTNASVIPTNDLALDLQHCRNTDQDCKCFDYSGMTYGITRDHMTKAMYNACMKFTGWIGEETSVYGMGEGLVRDRTSYYLYRATHNREEGQVAVTIHIKWDFDACMGPLPISYEYCWDQLHHPLDGCNTGGEDGKYGGVVYRDCVYWVLDPNPRVNYPYEGLLG